MKKVYISLMILCSAGIFAQSPGGIKNASLWFKTQENTSQSESYKDFSLNKIKINVKSKENKPIQKLFNYNESLFFDGIDDYLSSNFTMEDLVNLTFFTVYKDEGSESDRNLYFTENAFEKEMELSTSNIINNENTLEYNKNRAGIPKINAFVEHGLEANSIQEILSENGISTLNFGKSKQERKSFKGFLPEFIVFKKSLTKSERNRVESYLAIKYGITLQEFDYLNSKKQIIWDKNKSKNFQNNIAGIGRDDASGLYQKQSTSGTEDFRLIISAGNLQEKNSLNTSKIDNYSFLVWGNDSGNLTFQQEKDKNNMRFLNRKWLIESSGNGSKINSEVRLKIDDLLKNIKIEKDETLWLILDEASNNKFDFESLQAYDNKGFTSNQIIYKNINWDKDSSNSDNFSFAIGPNILTNFAVKGPTCSQHLSALSLNLKGGNLPYKVNLKQKNSSYNQTFTINSSDFNLEGLQTGTYTMEITDSKQKIQTRNFEVSGDSSLKIDLGTSLFIGSEPIELDASKYVTEKNVTYNWKSDNGFESSSAKIFVDKPGTYKVTAFSSEGCSNESQIVISQKSEQSIFIANNPANIQEGIHVIARLPEVKDILVKVYDMSGRLISTKNGFNSSEYDLIINVNHVGSYTVEIQTGTEVIVKKVLIK